MAFNLFIVMILIFTGGCREFYDEEFLEDEASLQQARNNAYVATLTSTDPALTTLAGNGRVELKDDVVSVKVELEGIPQNIVQIHYSFISAGCDQLNISVPNQGGTRSYSINESLSRDALAEDLRSSGAATSQGDINLVGKSLIVKAFPNFSGLPNPAGTNSVTIACGELTVGEVTDTDSTETTDPAETPDTGSDTGFPDPAQPTPTPPTDPFGRDPNTDPFGRPANNGF